MTKIALREFKERVLAKGRIGKNDVRLLQRDLLADGIWSREDAESLIGLDRAVESVHPSWTGWLASAVVDFVVWGARPTGYVDGEAADWIVAAIAGDGAATHRGARIAREICREAHGCDPRLAALAAGETAPAVAGAAFAAERLAA